MEMIVSRHHADKAVTIEEAANEACCKVSVTPIYPEAVPTTEHRFAHGGYDEWLTEADNQ